MRAAIKHVTRSLAWIFAFPAIVDAYFEEYGRQIGGIAAKKTSAPYNRDRKRYKFKPLQKLCKKHSATNLKSLFKFILQKQFD